MAGTGVENWGAGGAGFGDLPRALGSFQAWVLGERWGPAGAAGVPNLAGLGLANAAKLRAAPADQQRQQNTNAPDAQTLAAGDARDARGDLKCR